MEILLALLVFVFVSTITPGPNNFLLATSGIKFGFRATLRHVAGIHLGIYLLVLLCGLGIGQLLTQFPEALIALKVFGTVYLGYLAWRILGFELQGDEMEVAGQPMGLIEALIFQFSNPKAWMMATTGLNISIGLDESVSTAVLTLCLGFPTLGLICNFAWLSAGASLRSLWMDARYQKSINTGLSLLTLLAIGTFWFL